MRCPTCQAELADTASLCQRCGTPVSAAPSLPAPPLPAPQGAYAPHAYPAPLPPPPQAAYASQPYPAWAPPPATRRRSTDWTYPMQVAVAAWLVISALAGLLTMSRGHDTFVNAFIDGFNGSSGSSTFQNVQGLADAMFGVVIAILALWGLGKLGLAVAGYLRLWTWVFVTDMILLGINSLLLLITLLGLVLASAQGRDMQNLLVSGLVQLSAAALFLWMTIAAFRYGPWARERVPLQPPA